MKLNKVFKMMTLKLVVPVNCTATKRGGSVLERFWKGNMFKPGTAYVLKGVIVASAVIGGAYVVYKLVMKYWAMSVIHGRV